MSVIELIPLDKGTRFVLDQSIVTTIGRTPNIGCIDKKISRNHAELYVKSDGTLWMKPIHVNPTFYRTKSKELITLKKDEEVQLNHNDEIGLLPNEYFFRISIPSAIPKSPSPASIIQSPTKDPTVENEGGIILHTSRALPGWMSNPTTPEPKNAKGRAKSKTPVKPSPIDRKKAESIVYGEDDDDERKRERCPYGKFCYRKNPLHRQQAIHPGDPDWDDKENDTNTKKPECPYGSDCYRKNPDHFKEYSHTKKQRKAKSDDDEDDDDGLPNEYDYNDSFIDDEELEDSAHIDRAGGSESQGDADWKPHKKARHFDEDDDDDDDSSVDSEINLLKDEAAEFVQHLKKKARTQMPTEDDDDD